MLASRSVATLVVIEDEALLSRQIARALAAAGHEVRTEATGAAGIAAVEASAPDLVLVDLRLPDQSGLDVLERLRELDAELPVVLMTAYGSVADAVEAMRRGAADYLQKPLDLDELRLLVERVVARTRRDRELSWLRRRDRALPEGLIGGDATLVAAFEQARRIRDAGLPPGKRPAILISGETGTGKGMVARALHEVLGGGPFIEVNCTAMPESLVEAELFGHERGSFTDAKTERVGLFEAAEGGTLFLDEVGHASLSTQAKLLKVIEEKRVRRLGSSRERSVDVHVIAATNRDLDAAVRVARVPRGPAPPAARARGRGAAAARARRRPRAAGAPLPRRARPALRRRGARRRRPRRARALSVARQRARAAQRDGARRAARVRRHPRGGALRGPAAPARAQRRMRIPSRFPRAASPSRRSSAT